MDVFTIVLNGNNQFHLDQLTAESPACALAMAFNRLPSDLFKDQVVEILLDFAAKPQSINLIPCVSIKEVWLWIDGAKLNPQIIVYIVKSNVAA